MVRTMAPQLVMTTEAAGRTVKKPRARAAPKTFEFISSDPAGKAPADNRRFIRSHVMRGKNTKQQLALKRSSGQCQSKHHHNGGSSHATGHPHWPTATGLIPRNKEHFSLDRPDRPYLFREPSQGLPDYVPPEIGKMVYSFLFAMKEAMFPVEWCFQPDVTKACWIHWLSIDRAYFYSSIFVLSAMDDVVRDMRQRDLAVPRYGAGPLFSTTTSRYLRLTIQHLQEKLDDPRQQTDDVTIGVVIALGMVADAVGDTEAARAHISGLRQMAKLRGGPDAFGKNNPVLVKLYRFDLGFALKYGGYPEVPVTDLSWSPMLCNVIQSESCIEPTPVTDLVRDLVAPMDWRLCNIFYDMRAFSTVADGLVHSHNKLRPNLFQDMMVSMQHRLMFLRFDNQAGPATPQERQFGLVQEAFRLGMVAFQASIFLQVYSHKVRYDMLEVQLRHIIERLPENTVGLAHLKLWIVWVSTVAVLDPAEDWLAAARQRLTGDMSWDLVRQKLEDFLWIRTIHDAAGEHVHRGGQGTPQTVRVGMNRFWLGYLETA